PWQSGYAADCKSVDLGSTPGGASIIQVERPAEMLAFLLSGILIYRLFQIPLPTVYQKGISIS
ncbi:hypothetical protein, partial [Vibrio chagasii]|uniref:hypothetical protein n=1 Tax=Vibrio chagasii TaxID=170679 RepID=UPI003DA04C8D